MNSRRVFILLVTGLVIIGFAIWLASTRHLDRATGAGDLVLPGLEGGINTVTEIRITKGDETHTTLKKGASDWVVAERDYPADSGKVRKLLLDLGALNVVEEKTHSALNYPKLGVEDTTSPKATGTRVAAVTPTKVYEIIIGKSSNAKSGYVRVPTTELALLAAPSVQVDADPKRWLDHTLIDIQQERVKSVEEKPADAPAYTISREKKEQTDFTVSNIPKGRELSSPVAADPIAGALGGMTLDDVHKTTSPSDPSAASAPAATATDKSASSALAAPSGKSASPAPGATAAGKSPSAAPADKAAPATAKLPHAIYHTFDGLDLDVAGHKDGTHDLVTFTVHSTAKETADEAQKLTTQLQGYEYELPSYKYDAIFHPMDDLLKPVEPPKKGEKDKGKSGTVGTGSGPGAGAGGKKADRKAGAAGETP